MCVSAIDGQQPAITALECIRNYQNAEQSVMSYDIRLEVTTRLFFDIKDENGPHARRPIPKIDKFYYRQVIDGNNGRMESFNANWQAIAETRVFDREADKLYSHKSHTLDVLKRSNYVVPKWHDYLNSFRTVFGRISLARTLKDRKSAKCVVLSDPNLLLVTVEPQPNTDVTHPNNMFRAVFSIKDGFLPNLIEELYPVGDAFRVYSQTEVLERTPISNGLLMPTRSVTRLFLYNSPGQELEVLWEAEMRVDLKQSSWNQPNPENVFEMPIPAGTRVRDTRMQASFVTGQLDPGKNLDELVKTAKEVFPSTFVEMSKAHTINWKLWIGLAVVTGGTIAFTWSRLIRRGN